MYLGGQASPLLCLQIKHWGDDQNGRFYSESWRNCCSVWFCLTFIGLDEHYLNLDGKTPSSHNKYEKVERQESILHLKMIFISTTEIQKTICYIYQSDLFVRSTWLCMPLIFEDLIWDRKRWCKPCTSIDHLHFSMIAFGITTSNLKLTFSTSTRKCII